MNYFELNTTTLFTHAPGLKDALSSYSEDKSFEIVPTPSGNPSAIYRGITVHSRHNPAKEAQTLIAREVPAQVSICLFYGFGLGYLVESFIRSFPDIPCLVVEPDVGCFLKALTARDLRPILDHPRVVFFLAAESVHIVQFLESQELSTVHIIKLRSLYEKDRAYYERTDALIQSFLRQREVNTNTLKRFGKLWVRNLFKNITLTAEAPGIKLLAGCFTGMPALVLAGGPSLDEVLPYIAILKERMLVIAVDTTLAAVQRAGCDPDLTVICDPQYWNTRHIDWVKKTDSFLISESSTHPRIFRCLGENVFFAGSLFPLGQYIESLVGEKGKLGAGGSVATTAWDCARYLGCSLIVMAGLDLGFPEKKTHFHGGCFEELFYCRSRRFFPYETFAFNYINDAQPFAVPSNSGGLVLTDHRMAVYKFWFETQMRLFPDLPTFTLSSQGVRIEGMRLMERTALQAYPEQRNLIEAKKRELRSLRRMSDGKTTAQQSLKEGLEKLCAELETLGDIAVEGLRIAREAKKRLRRHDDIGLYIKKLDTVDEKIKVVSSKHVASFLAAPLIREIVDAAPGGAQPEDSLEYSLKLYSELESSARFHAALVKRSLSAM